MTSDHDIDAMLQRFFDVPCLVCKGRWGTTFGDAYNCHTGVKEHKFIPDFSTWMPTLHDINVAFGERSGLSVIIWKREAGIWAHYLAQANGVCSDYD